MFAQTIKILCCGPVLLLKIQKAKFHIIDLLFGIKSTSLVESPNVVGPLWQLLSLCVSYGLKDI